MFIMPFIVSRSVAPLSFNDLTIKRTKKDKNLGEKRTEKKTFYETRVHKSAVLSNLCNLLTSVFIHTLKKNQ